MEEGGGPDERGNPRPNARLKKRQRPVLRLRAMMRRDPAVSAAGIEMARIPAGAFLVGEKKEPAEIEKALRNRHLPGNQPPL